MILCENQFNMNLINFKLITDYKENLAVIFEIEYIQYETEKPEI